MRMGWEDDGGGVGLVLVDVDAQVEVELRAGIDFAGRAL
jgi:hypothetical protein